MTVGQPTKQTSVSLVSHSRDMSTADMKESDMPLCLVGPSEFWFPDKSLLGVKMPFH